MNLKMYLEKEVRQKVVLSIHATCIPYIHTYSTYKILQKIQTNL